jgi:predicted transcriptional regulator
MRQVNVRLDDELIKRVKQFALDNDLSIQDVMRIALNDLLFMRQAVKESTHIPKTEAKR